ncbi:hypothetical protein ACOSP7_029109 [Xanthoceras sorbifolium]|uniref:Small auxin up regulated protein n=1 Tax=Xanthoceras sorbifolium TaxID=99658 RepID=A0ABQ8HBS5_9ROSI|nr:hypothetical protein JRO89_XS12G0084200 [Xanthoceras sorbifolium]KAH7553953.1 hypothetical protein JRO89_XS12G0084700 [Xanthoceras sorbifolium]
MSSFLKKILRRSHSNNTYKQYSYKKLEVGYNNKKNAKATMVKIPKGFVPIYVRENEEDEEADQLIRYVVPITYLSCPPLKEFIKQSQDDEFETYFDGPITLSCTPHMFEQLLEACRKLSQATSNS